MSYAPRPASSAQIRRLVVEFDRLAGEGDPRACGPKREPYERTREDRLAWASAHIGVQLHSFNELTGPQAGYLLDILNGKATALDRGLADDWKRLRVNDPAAYFATMCSRGPQHFGQLFWRFKGLDLSQLSMKAKWELRRILARRQPAA
ncbi:MAG: hypothetical protein HS116_02270 [Planctomycetes bacterium]|nr:hypothetical protein [Planctomycetota bacterium]